MEKVTTSGAMALGAAVAMLLMLLPFGGAAAAAAAAATGAVSSNCTRICGNISIPFPFGIEPSCYHSSGSGGFNLTCNHSFHPPELFLGDGTVQVLDISIEHSTVRINSTGVELSYFDDPNYGQNATRAWGAGLPRNGPYFLSESTNMLQAIGCGIQVSILGGENNSSLSSCTALCPTLDLAHLRTVGNGSCSGIACCQAIIVLGLTLYTIQINTLGSSPIIGVAPSVYIVDQIYHYDWGLFYGEGRPHALPATLDWTVNNSRCPTNMITAPECRSTHSYCQDFIAEAHGGYICKCSQDYHGNPYIPGGCEDIDECKYPDTYICYGQCKNTPGSFICQCNTGYTGNSSHPNGCKDIDECKDQEVYSCYGICQNFPGSFQCQCPDGTYGNSSIKGGCITIKNSFTGLSIGLGIGGGTSLLLLALGGPYILRKIKLQKVKRMKHNFFKQNHGLLLQQLISRSTDIGERMIITLCDIEKATNNFDRARVIGGGGHGVVFKGILDLHVVAIKKSKIVVQREINEFINEVVVLSQVNHRNVVKLLGCCLETEVPLLVYEFISNGTLCHHLHVEGPMSLPWHDRMRIGAEVAKAISYLHASASMPIFHRDIKSSNILLDDALTAKVSDFGASRYIPADQTGVTTIVQGTMGYLDPMYYYTGRLTDKSDVFSFGVLLVELLTRKKPYVYRSVDDDGLVSHFASLLAEGKLADIVDPQVMEEEDGEIQEIATLAAMCTKLKCEDRPTMREVEMTLESLLVKKRQVPFNGTRPTNSGETATPCMSTGRGTKEASRQYTMEEEMLLSASFPR